MLELNIPNFVTVGLISVAFFALLQFLMQQFNINIPWLSA
jgi:hypothetical protein